MQPSAPLNNATDPGASSPVDSRFGGNGRAIRILIIGAVLLGAWLRLVWLREEAVAGDEVHPIASLAGSLVRILTHYQLPDNCIPISAWCKVLSLTVGLEELGLRSMAFLPGILLVWLAARATKRFLSPSERLILVLVLATSPLLVFWSRTGRPYSAISLLGVLAVLTMLRYGELRALRWAVACAFCQYGLFLFSPTTAPALVGLNLAAIVWGLQGGAPGSGMRLRLATAGKMMLPGALAVVITLALMAFALPSLVDLLRLEKPRTTTASQTTWVQFTQILYGFPRSPSPLARWLLWLPVAFTLLGLLRFCLRYRALALAAVFCCLTSPALYALSEFKGLGYSAVFTRYQAATIPLYLILLTYGIGGGLSLLWRSSPHLGRAGLAVAISLVAILAISGPLQSGLGPRAPHGLLYSRLFERWPLEQIAAVAQVPDFYRQIEAVEDPTLYECYINTKIERQLSIYQRVHGGRVIRCFGSKTGPEGQVDFRTFLVGLEALETEVASGAYVVMHHSPTAEKHLFLRGGFRGKSKPDEPESSQPLARFAAERGRELFGEPVYEDPYITVFGHRLEGAPIFYSPPRKPRQKREPLSDSPLAFAVTPGVVSPGGLVTFETTAGQPGEYLALTTVGRDGEAVSVAISSGVVGSTGVWRRAMRIPLSSPEVTLTFELTGNRHDDAQSAEHRVQVVVRESRDE